MEYNSFYGGRRGASFVIVKRYKTIKAPAEDNLGFNKIIRQDLQLPEDAEISSENRNKWLAENCMVYCFSQAGGYKTVNYDEYVLIDTYNKNDIDNGKVYRRGYEYNNDMGGAVYIGQIVGPAGMAPHTELENYDTIQKMTTEDGLVIPNDGTTIEDGELNQYRKTQATLDILSAEEGSGDLLPGQYYENGEEKFNDTIEYIACSIRDFESHESTVHIGFKIPYHVPQYTAESVSPYYHRTDDAKYLAEEVGKGKPWEGWSEQGNTTDFDNAELIERTDDLLHPFFSKWHISIPKGIKGETFNNFRVVQAVDIDNSENGIHFGTDEGQDPGESYRDTSETYKKQILVYDYYNYDRDASGDPISIYLGNYNMIDNFRIDEDGTIVIDYTHNHRDYYPNYLKAVDRIQINPETGLLQIDYNYDQEYERDENGDFILDVNGEKIPIPDTTTHYETHLQYIKDITLDENGTMTFSYSYKDNIEQKNEIFENKIRWINSVAISSTQGATDEGHLIVTYNTKRDNGTDNDIYETDLKWVNNISLSEDGLLTLHYSGNGEDVDVNTNNKIKWIDSIILAEDGTLTVNYNNGDAPSIFSQAIKWITNTEILIGENEGEGNQKLKITYNDGTFEEVGNPINYIMQTVISDDYHLLILYSDPAKRNEIIAQGLNATYNGRNDWYDLGYIGQGSIGTVAGKESDEVVASIAQTLPPYSSWIIVEED